MISRARSAASAALVLALAPLGLAGLAGAAVADVAPDDLGGTPVGATSTDVGDPVELTAGLWADTLGPPESPEGTHQFSYARTIANSTVHVAVVGASVPDSGDSLVITATAPGEVSCGSDSDSSSYAISQGFGAGLSIGASDYDELEAPCLRADVIAFSVDHGSGTAQELPVAIRIVEEAPVVGPVEDLPLPPEDLVAGRPDVSGEPVEVQGATSYADAPALTGGTTYADAVTEGDELRYRVSLDWGQRLAVRVDVPRHDATAQGAIEEFGSTPDVTLTVADPLRDSVGELDESVTLGGYAADEDTVLLDGTAPVGYLNRFEGEDAWLPGDYTVSIAVQPAADRDPLEVPVEISVGTLGEPAGAPTYAETVQGPGATAGPDGYDAATPYLVAPGRFAATLTDLGSSEQATGAGADEGLGTRRIGGLALGAVSLLCVGAGVVLLRRRRA